MLEPETTEIDGRTYEYTPLMLKPARNLFDKLLQRFGPAVASAVEELNEADIQKGMSGEEAIGSATKSLGGLMRGLVAGLDPKFHEELATTLAKQTRVEWGNDDGEQKMMALTDVRELLFGRRIMTEFEVIIWCLRVQYADFLEPLQSLVSTALTLRAKAVSHSDSPKGSTGIFTGSPSARDTPTA